MKILSIFKGIITKLDLFSEWGSFLCILGYFLRSMYRIGISFGVARISNTCWLIFFGGKK